MSSIGPAEWGATQEVAAAFFQKSKPFLWVMFALFMLSALLLGVSYIPSFDENTKKNLNIAGQISGLTLVVFLFLYAWQAGRSVRSFYNEVKEKVLLGAVARGRLAGAESQVKLIEKQAATETQRGLTSL